MLNILFIGDIVGKPGLDMTLNWLPGFIQKYKAELVIVNGENVNEGKGITQKEGQQLFDIGVHVITGGNHTWDKPLSQEFLKVDNRSLRPFNYPRGTYGNGYYIADTKKGKIAVLNLQGRTYMPLIDCPFRSAEWVISKFKEEVKGIIIDFHAEATAEKQSLLYFLDGKVSAILGTHTHVQTSDERITSQGTAYITDVGMTGPYESVIGMKVTPALNRFLYQTPQKYEAAKEDVHICGVFLKIDMNTGKCVEIERIFFPEFPKSVE